MSKLTQLQVSMRFPASNPLLRAALPAALAWLVLAAAATAQPADEDTAGSGSAADTAEEDETPERFIFDADELRRQVRPPSSDTEEIIITGEKGAGTSQGQALAITEFGQADLDELGIVDVDSLAAFVPSLHIGQVGQQAIVTLRGVGFSNLTVVGEPGVVFEQDGVPQARPSAANALFFDVEDVQVLRGPQGTQGGRQSTGGRIALRSARPTPDFEAFGDFQYGSYNQRLSRGVINVPIAGDYLMTRVSVIHELREGFQRNVLQPNRLLNGDPVDGTVRNDDADDLALRGQLMSRPLDELEVRVIGSYAQQRGFGPGFRTIGRPSAFLEDCPDDAGFGNCPAARLGPPGIVRTDGGPRTTSAEVAGDQDAYQATVTGHLFYELPTLPTLGDTRVGLIGGWARNRYSNYFDLDTTNAPFAFLGNLDFNFQPGQQFDFLAFGNILQNNVGPFVTDAKQWTFEGFLESIEGEVVDFKVGYFHLLERNSSTNFVGALLTSGGGALNRTSNEVFTTSDAGYGEIGYWLLDNLRLMGGMRYTNGTKDVTNLGCDQPGQLPEDPENPNPPPANPNIAFACAERPGRFKKGWSAWTPKVQAEWKVTDENQIVIGATRGFKLGGFSLVGDNRNVLEYDPETDWNYEVTSKNDLFDGILRLNLTLFWTTYDGYQSCQIQNQAFRCNVGEATSRGIEVEGFWEPIPGLRINGNFNYLDATIDKLRLIDPTERSILPGGQRNPLAGFPKDVSGNRLPNAPEFNVNIGVQYEIELADWGLMGFLTPRVQYQWQDRTYFRTFNIDEFSQAPFHEIDFKATWRSEDDRWSVEGFVDNLTNVDVINSIQIGPDAIGAPVNAQYRPPRVWGVRFGFRYN